MLLCGPPEAAHAQSANTSVQGFGGLTFGTSSAIGRTSTASTIGGIFAAGLTPNIQISVSRPDAVIDTGLAFLNRTEPLLGVGGGVLLERGPLAVDVGYRYKKIMPGGIASALNAGNAYQINEVRFGLGVRF